MKIIGSEVKKGVMPLLFLLSLFGHLGCWHLMVGVCRYEFALPLKPLEIVTVHISGAAETPAGILNGKVMNREHQCGKAAGAGPGRLLSPASPTGDDRVVGSADGPVTGPKPQRSPPSGAGDTARAQGVSEQPEVVAEPEYVSKQDSSPGPFLADYGSFQGPVRNGGEFVKAGRERLTYQVFMLKIPVGSAVVEATNQDGEFRISTRILSNAFLSGFYPVDDWIETRMIKGNYLLTRVRQMEGNHRGDFGFTLMLRERKAFWVDRLRNRYDYQPLPDEATMDVISGLYFLRNQRLEVGKEIMLPIFDGDEFTHVTVEVLGRERIVMANGSGMDALVLRPRLKTDGTLRHSGDFRIWLSDDQYRSPLRIETSIPLGKVTAHLVSAETER